MTIEEFIERTEHIPETDKEWREITRDYLKYDWEDKDMFCRRWLIEHGFYKRIGKIYQRQRTFKKIYKGE